MTTVYVIVILGLIFFLAAGYTLYQIDRERATTSLVTRTSFWIVSQVEFELLRFRSSIDEYVADSPNGNAENVQFRLDILWSRIPPAMVGVESEWLRSAPGAKEALNSLVADLERYDQTIQAISEASLPTLRAVSEELVVHIDRIHGVALEMHVGNYRQGILKRIEDLQRETVTLLITLTIVGGLTVMLLLVTAHSLRKAVDREHTMRVAAEDASRAKSQFLANMSHELRTPLNAILGFSEIIRDQLLGPKQQDKYTDYAGDINRSAVYLKALVDDVLDMAKIEAGRMQIVEQPFRLSETVEWCINTVRERAEKRSLSIAKDVQHDPTFFLGDERIIRQIILNLLSNSIKFTPEAGTITISVKLSDSGSILILVADTGIGIAEDDLELVLEPFGQVEEVMTKSSDGTGLGLPLCRQFAELHDGRLDITSTVGEGTCVTIELPAWRARHDIAQS